MKRTITTAKGLGLVLCFALGSWVVWAQDQINAGLQDQMEVVTVEDSSMASPSQKVIIIEGEKTLQNAQQQPTTYVEASPLTESRAERIRRQRQEAEVQTEQKIVEKLEASRLEDEKKRSDKLFGDRLNSEPEPAPVYAQQQQQQQVVVPEQSTESEDIHQVKDEILTAVNELKTQKEEIEKTEKSEKDEEFYISGAVGAAEYVNDDNVDGDKAMGFTLGWRQDQMMVEGGFMYSTYIIDEYWKDYYQQLKDLDQYNFTGALKYSLLLGRIRPIVGALFSYTRRNYNNVFEDSVSTNAYDAGLTGGVEFDLTDNFAVGFNYSYLFNVYTNNENKLMDAYRARAYDYCSSCSSGQGSKVSLEKLSYQFLTLTGRISF